MEMGQQWRFTVDLQATDTSCCGSLRNPECGFPQEMSQAGYVIAASRASSGETGSCQDQHLLFPKSAIQGSTRLTVLAPSMPPALVMQRFGLPCCWLSQGGDLRGGDTAGRGTVYFRCCPSLPHRHWCALTATTI